MNDILPLVQLPAGQFSGTKRLWLSPGAPAQESHSDCTLELVPGCNIAMLRYSWSYGDKPQTGILLIRNLTQSASVDMVWTDSWHMPGVFMLCRRDQDSILSCLGSYSVPGHPDWGWRITVTPEGSSTLVLSMHNITPDGQEMLAVEVEYCRMKDRN